MLAEAVQYTEETMRQHEHETFPSVAYQKHAGNIKDGLKVTGFLENCPSDRQHKVFYNPASKKQLLLFVAQKCVFLSEFGVICKINRFNLFCCQK